MENLEFKSFLTSPDHFKERLEDNGIVTATSKEQIKVEKNVSYFYDYVKSNPAMELSSIKLNREKHISYLRKSLKHLPSSNSVLDASRPWLLYWSLHALELLNYTVVGEEASEIVEFLKKCQNPDGGYGGGPSQYSHLAPTYAAVCALAIIGTKEAFDSIDRNSLSKFLWRMKTEEGAFMMHESGEIDIRGVYCAVSVARLTNIYTEDLFRNTSHWVLSCQTYEGGFSGSPGLEAHGGYTFCGLAALILLRAQHLCNTDSLLRWGVNRQMRFEGGFQGRTNKLVDGCYSFWQGGLFPIIHSILSLEGNNSLSAERWMFHQEALQEYLLICCQYSKGGLIDKPGKSPDLYHTCYTLSGLSIAQHFIVGNRHKKVIVGNPSNELAPVHTLYNIGVESAVAASQYFNQLSVPITNNVPR
ncbi:UNVERIFIED_CONTAM: hypothetical protein RMT77_005953 [Armadillidium vulgare]